MNPIPGMPYQTRTFDTAKSQIPSEQGVTLTHESVSQSEAAEEQTKSNEATSLGLVEAGLDVSSDPSLC